MAVLLALLTTPAFPAGVEVRVVSGRVDVKTSGGPLSEALDALATNLGFKLVRDSGVPNPQLPAFEFKGRTPVEAVISVLEGQGLNYAFTMDPTGTQIEMLILTVAMPPQPARAPTPAALRGGMRPSFPSRAPISAAADAPADEEEPMEPDVVPLLEPEPDEPASAPATPSGAAPQPRGTPGPTPAAP